jgi:glycosyltransferase involved in cell wall biosynthesis
MKVSVVTTTYNQEKYIEQALRSALDQQASFDYEVLVGEDCSTDGTRDVLRRLEAEFPPPRLKVVYNERNLGLFTNYRNVFARCTGEYMAFLEGDDYWIGADKLQKQVDYLDAHPDAAACFHDTLVFQEVGGQQELFRKGLSKERYDELDVLEDLFLHSSSLVTRTRIVHQLGVRSTEKILGDWPFFMFLAKFGYFGRVEGVMSAHRKHATGIWNQTRTQDRIRDMVDFFDWANELYDHRHDRFIQAMKKHWRIHFLAEAKILELAAKLQEAARLLADKDHGSNAPAHPTPPAAGR